MTDLSKRLREWGQPQGYPVCVFPDDPDVVGDRIVPARDMMEMWTLMTRAADALEWQPTHRHYKGGLYRVVAEGRIEADLSPAVIYDDKEGNVWVRPHDDFHGKAPDGVADRFMPLPTPPEGE